MDVNIIAVLRAIFKKAKGAWELFLRKLFVHGIVHAPIHEARRPHSAKVFFERLKASIQKLLKLGGSQPDLQGSKEIRIESRKIQKRVVLAHVL